MSSQGGSFSHQGIYVGSDWTVRCSTYDDHTPILDIDAGPVCVSVSVATRQVADDATVNFARELVRQAQVFAAEVERIHALQAGTGDKAAEGTAA